MYVNVVVTKTAQVDQNLKSKIVSRAKVHLINEWKQVSFLAVEILIFLNIVPEFLKWLVIRVVVSFKLVSYKNAF